MLNSRGKRGEIGIRHVTLDLHWRGEINSLEFVLRDFINCLLVACFHSKNPTSNRLLAPPPTYQWIDRWVVRFAESSRLIRCEYEYEVTGRHQVRVL
jgi:hypothetical protein